MGKAGSRGRILPRRRSPVSKAKRARGFEVLERGDLGEVAFVHKAMSLRFVVAKPYGHNHRYDFILEGGKKLWRIQVKTCTYLRNDLYTAHVVHSLNGAHAAYTEADFDFVAVYIMPEETWYVLPVREAAGRKSLKFRGPSGIHRRDPYAYYREAWHLLREPDGLTFG
jgi:PD-(D/E)XK endonuclease